MSAAALYLYRSRDANHASKSLSGVLATLFDRSVWLHPSALVDYGCYAINALLTFVLKLGGMAGGAITGGLVYVLLILSNGGRPLAAMPGVVSLGLYTLLSLLLVDLGKYAGHYMQHRSPLLWEFHKVHHSAQVLTPLTLFRTHPLDVMFYDFVSGLFFGIGSSIGLFVFGAATSPWEILGLNAGVFLFYILGANLRHSHVWLPYPAWLSRILISPAQHQIHHSALRKHHDRNFGVLFAFWDWLFGTLYIPKEREPLVFGLSDGEDAEYQSLRSLYFLPLTKAWRRVRSRRAGPAPAPAPGADGNDLAPAAPAAIAVAAAPGGGAAPLPAAE
jgi:sterol desaturase/sphingolipid hydroxylase (fatty acid hydroxylase superfamily)